MLESPATRSEVIENRAFLRRAVRYLASRGITQYLDLGSGYPASGAVHRTAAELITSPRGGVRGSRPAGG